MSDIRERSVQLGGKSGTFFPQNENFRYLVEVPKLAGPGGSAGGWKVLGIIQTVAEEPDW